MRVEFGTGEAPPAHSSSIRTRDDVEPLLRPTYRQLPVRVPAPTLGTRRNWATHRTTDRQASPGGVHNAHSQAEEAARDAATGTSARRRQGAFDEEAGVRPH